MNDLSYYCTEIILMTSGNKLEQIQEQNCILLSFCSKNKNETKTILSFVPRTKNKTKTYYFLFQEQKTN